MPRGRWRLHAFEIAALGMAAGVLGFLAGRGLPVGGRGLGGTVTLAVTLLVGAGSVGIGLQCAWRALSGRGVRAYLRRVLEPAWLVLWVRLWLACMLASHAYFWLKVYVPVLHDASFDTALWQLDRLLHLGLSPTALTQSLLCGGTATRALDVYYGLWLPSLAAGVACLAASDDAALRRGGVLSCIALWGLGASGYLAFPVVGPAFAYPGFFRELAAQMPIAAATQENLWTHYGAVSAGGPVTDYTRGVGALPSLHVGFHFLFALWARRAAPPLFPVLLVVALVTQLGAVRTGWHYASDGYVGAGLAWIAFTLGRKLEGVGAPDPSPRPPGQEARLATSNAD